MLLGYINSVSGPSYGYVDDGIVTFGVTEYAQLATAWVVVDELISNGSSLDLAWALANSQATTAAEPGGWAASGARQARVVKNGLPGVPNISDRINLELREFKACLPGAGLIAGLIRVLPGQETVPFAAATGADKDAQVVCLGLFPLAALSPGYQGLDPGVVFPSDAFWPF